MQENTFFFKLIFSEIKNIARKLFEQVISLIQKK